MARRRLFSDSAAVCAAPFGEQHRARASKRLGKIAACDAPLRDSQSLFESLAARAKAFAEKLEFTAEVEALGITEEQAKALGIGVHRAHVYCAMRYENSVTAGFLHIAAGKLILPKNLLPDQARDVVTFPKRA
jgi:hypothetical protein